MLWEQPCASSNCYPKYSETITIKLRVPSCHCQFCSSLPFPRWAAVGAATTGIPSLQHPTYSFLPAARFRLSWVLAPTPAGCNVSNTQRGGGQAGSCSPVLGVFLSSWACHCVWDMQAALGLLPAVGWARTRAFLLHSGSASGLLPPLVTSTLSLLGPIV